MFMKCLVIILCPCLCLSPIPVDNIDNVTWVPHVARSWPAQKGDVPYQVALKGLVSRVNNEYKTFCSAVIIAPVKLITAAHCFHKAKTKCEVLLDSCVARSNRFENTYAVAGNLLNVAQFYRSDSEQNGQWRTLRNVYYPRKYKFPNHDIAVVYISRRFHVNKFVAPIPMASLNSEYYGTCLVSGFGMTINESNASTLILAQLDVIPTRECNVAHRRDMKLFVCTISTLTDVERGDSGGPLVCANTDDPNEGSRGVLVGVVSGHRPEAGSFFTRVSRYKNFIRGSSSHSIQKSNVSIIVCTLIASILGTLLLF